MSSSGPTAEESGTKTRTRAAILETSISVLAADSGASLSEIAKRAGVGRTTLHRYFPERSDLTKAVRLLAHTQVERATLLAELDHGSAIDALDRLCQQYLELGDTLTVLFNDPEIVDEPELDQDSETDMTYKRTVARGHEEGSIDREMDTDWVVSTLWALLYVTNYRIMQGKGSRLENLSLCRRSLRKSISA